MKVNFTEHGKVLLVLIAVSSFVSNIGTNQAIEKNDQDDTGWGKKRMPSCNQMDRGDKYSTLKSADFLYWSEQ